MSGEGGERSRTPRTSGWRSLNPPGYCRSDSCGYPAIDFTEWEFKNCREPGRTAKYESLVVYVRSLEGAPQMSTQNGDQQQPVQPATTSANESPCARDLPSQGSCAAIVKRSGPPSGIPTGTCGIGFGSPQRVQVGWMIALYQRQVCGLLPHIARQVLSQAASGQHSR